MLLMVKLMVNRCVMVAREPGAGVWWLLRKLVQVLLANEDTRRPSGGPMLLGIVQSRTLGRYASLFVSNPSTGVPRL